jgi:hypothetical protein
MVEKKDTKIYRMCINFTTLNKHCPKDYFPLPQIDQIIDSTAGCKHLSFLDAYSGYNEIRLKVEDEYKIAFITPPQGVLLHDDAVRFEERWSHLATAHPSLPEGVDRLQRQSLRQRYRHQDLESRQPTRQFA